MFKLRLRPGFHLCRRPRRTRASSLQIWSCVMHFTHWVACSRNLYQMTLLHGHGYFPPRRTCRL